ncbi:MAG: hypothetical protein A3J48_02255 [Candidatus Doudnabacteria bacterium RIFCSPHIGHO2_02_FULL_46_11]|uniref:Addiction module toxin, HicA family n=1 Tax=Candidatus Doudnabacteria bacterium RIFCSPHIGHO2_02_FULL_46_11 TaxID=1817832 RepID=A0A1F5P878_9BACT|nr:MAG: hypothetical protein A3J48_02255 [Candidatus Doudnabacteria bacterium RIFCSPHIGHO2_02_FULL_46_11]
MTKFPALKPKHVIRVLEQVGFIFIRQKGSHRIFVKDDVGITVPVHNKDLKPGTLRSIIKASGLTDKDFINLL